MRFLAARLVGILALALSPAMAAPMAPQAVLFTGARLIVGDGRPAIEHSAFLVEDGRFVRVGLEGRLVRPRQAAQIDLRGKTVIPTLVDAHVHVGYRKGLSFSAANYTRDTLVDTFNRFAYFGVAAVFEAGTGRGELPFDLQRERVWPVLFRTADRGIAMPDAGPGGPMRDAAYGVRTEQEARNAVRELSARGIELVKIWVDDREGTVEKLHPNLYRAIIAEAHAHRQRVMAHAVALEDVKDLVRSGVDGLAHPVKDKDVDDELIGLLTARPHVFVLGTLWGERGAVYSDRPPWLDDPILAEAFSSREIADLSAPFEGGPPPARTLEHGARVMRNVGRLAKAGVRIGLGTDVGGVTGGEFFGLASQIELELLVKTGVTPAQAITMATRNSANILGLETMGTVEAGKTADFMVLDANPLDDIRNTRRISSVYVSGRECNRAALRQSTAKQP